VARFHWLSELALSPTARHDGWRPASFGAVCASEAGCAGIWREYNIGVKPEADTLDGGDLRRLLAGAFGGRAQVAA